jgi:hypothetical protein
MRTARARRISRQEVEELLSGRRVSADREALLRLLDEVAAPARPEELTGRKAAVAGFVQALRDPVPPHPPVRRRRRPLFLLTRAALVKAVVGLGVLLFGGMAVAAGTGNLPAGVQHGAHALLSPLGVPVPDATGRHGGGSRSGTGADRSSGSAAGPGRTGVGTGPTTAGPAAAVVGLCRVWDATRKPGHDRPMDPAAWQSLVRAAGSSDKVPAFCAAVLAAAPAPGAGTDPDAGPTHPGQPGGKPSHSPKGNPKHSDATPGP